MCAVLGIGQTDEWSYDNLLDCYRAKLSWQQTSVEKRRIGGNLIDLYFLRMGN